MRIVEKASDQLHRFLAGGFLAGGLFSRRGTEFVRIHPTFPVSVVFIGMLFPIASWIGLAPREMATVVTTLPFIWVGSVIVRFAAQQYFLGNYAGETQFVIGPSGNQSIDYEFLPRSRLLAYAFAGQFASLVLVAVGLLVVIATLGAATSGAEWYLHNLLDFRGGWSNRAIGSQIVWVNLFLLTLHFLPTVPFDMRAAVFGVIRRGEPMALEPRSLRHMSGLDTHLAAAFLGVGASCLVISLVAGVSTGWYAFLGAAMYLFVAGRWEGARAAEAEQQYSHMPLRESLQRRRQPIAKGPHFSIAASDDDEGLERTSVEDVNVLDLDHAIEALDEETLGENAAVSADLSEEVNVDLDLDEILRKLHREGADALSNVERDCLMSASKELNARREAL